MKTLAKNDFQIVTYGSAFSRCRNELRGLPVSSRWKPSSSSRGEYLIVSSEELDEEFVENFREHASNATRLLVFLSEGASTDTVVAKIVDLQIRTSERFCVIEAKFGCGKSHISNLALSFLRRLASALEAGAPEERILEARIEDGTLRAISPQFDRLDISLGKIAKATNTDPSKLHNFEIDDDGSFIYWPSADVHLGWHQLQQLVNPEAALKTSQKSEEFNKRYGKAIQKIREQAGLALSDIKGISDKQLRRIESGESRATSNAIDVLSKAHGLSASEYMAKVADTLGTFEAGRASFKRNRCTETLPSRPKPRTAGHPVPAQSDLRPTKRA